MYTTRLFAKHPLSTCVIGVLFFSLSMAGSATAIPLPAPVAEQFPSPIATLLENEFTTWTIEMMIPTASSLPAGLLKLTLPSEQAEFNTEVVSIDSFSDIAAFQRVPIDPNYSIIMPSFFDLPRSALLFGTEGTFPLLADHAQAFVPSAQYDVFSDIPIPEPGTLILFLMAFGMFALAWRRHRRK